MGKRAVKTGIKLLMWKSHHEPRRVINGPLSYYLEAVHSGSGYDQLVEKHGPEEALTIVGFFNRLQQRTAQLRREWRGYVLDGAQKPASVALLAHEYGLSEPRVEGLVKSLVDVGWLGRRPLRRLLGKPLGAPIPNTDTETNTQTNTDTEDAKPVTRNPALRRACLRSPPPSGSDSGFGKQVCSDSGSRDKAERMVLDLELRNAAERIANVLHVARPADHVEGSRRRKQALADLVTISKAVEHLRDEPAAIETLERLAAEVSEGTMIKKPVAAWVKRVQVAGLFYKSAEEPRTCPA